MKREKWSLQTLWPAGPSPIFKCSTPSESWKVIRYHVCLGHGLNNTLSSELRSPVDAILIPTQRYPTSCYLSPKTCSDHHLDTPRHSLIALETIMTIWAESLWLVGWINVNKQKASRCTVNLTLFGSVSKKLEVTMTTKTDHQHFRLMYL